LSPNELLLDPGNPSLAGHEFALEEQDRILEWLWKNKSVNELVDSIVASGFWQHEELFASREKGRLVVVEGNRRLAAVKVLTDASLRARLRLRDFGPLNPEVQASLEKLPVLIRPRQEIWEFIGFKHVNGPQEWDSIAKAQYIYRVRKEFGVELPTIARTIGDRHDTVARLYSGYLVLKQAQDLNLFDPDDCYRKKLPFSHLWTALGYSNVRTFLGVDSERLLQPDPVPHEKLEDLQTLLLWLFGSQRREIRPIVDRQNPDLRHLVEALGNPKGIQILRADLPLAAAFEASLGDERLFQDALIEAEHNLREAKRFVATGYHGEEHLLETSANVETLAKSLRREIGWS
jgi:hypothetical protein